MLPQTDVPLRHSHWNLLLILLMLILGAALRLVSLPREALSGDELFSRRVVLQTLPSAYVDVRDDLVHPPFYYAVLKAGTSVWGAGALGLRAVSLACGISAIAVTVLLGSRLPGSQWSGYLAGTGLAVGRNYIFYSQEARSYALYTLLVLLLVLWIEAIARHQRSTTLWAAGAALMTLLVYTHYVGGLYIIAAILTLLACRLESRTKVLALSLGLGAAVLFAPWLYAVAGAYRRKHGLGENLGWQGQPGFSDLKQVWASSLGIMSFPGATTVALLLIVGLAAAALFSVSRTSLIRKSPAVLCLAIMGVLPPIILFGLSKPPFSLPLFALRHLLPSTVMLLLLCSYGVERLCQLARGESLPVAAAASTCFLAIGALPTVGALKSGPMRYPYDLVEQRVEQSARIGVPAYTPWFYGEGAPVNFYCGSECVHPLPQDEMQLPKHLILIYRPGIKDEAKDYNELIRHGYIDLGHVYYTDGLRTAWGTMAADLKER